MATEKPAAVFEKVEDGSVGFVEELSGANSRGATLEEARANLREAVGPVLEANRFALKREAARSSSQGLQRPGDSTAVKPPVVPA